MKGKIKIENKGISLNLNGEFTTEDIKELNNFLKLFNQTSQIVQSDKFSFSELSKDLKTNKEFQKIQDKLNEEYEDYHYVKYTKLNKIIEIKQEKDKIKTVSKINSKELNNKLETLFDDVEVPNIEFVIIHTVGDLENKEHEKLFFSIHDKLLEVPTKHIITKKETNKVLLELVFFGRDVVDESYFDMD